MVRPGIILALVVVLGAGCAGSNSSKTPTHRWASGDAVDQIQYRRDHATCQQNAGFADASEFDANSDAFAVYKQCMIGRGYMLTASRTR